MCRHPIALVSSSPSSICLFPQCSPSRCSLSFQLRDAQVSHTQIAIITFPSIFFTEFLVRVYNCVTQKVSVALETSLCRCFFNSQVLWSIDQGISLSLSY